ncbi:MAG TPA: thioredoxin family protein [Pseudobacter sp.]|nr:thioredoxin family protein [Pseudobacter sp.]
MRTYILLCVTSMLVIASACQPKIQTNSKPTALNQLIRDAQGNPDLYGQSTEEGMKQPPFDTWYITNYNAYTPDSNIILRLRPELRGKTIEIFMGTWCGDSKREVPRMLKVLSQCGVPPTAIRIINVGKSEHDYKQSPTHEERGKNIHRVPTLIVYQDGKEINRLVETPVQSIEKDLLQIARKEAYVPKYLGAAWMLQWYSHPDWAKHEHDSVLLAADLKKIVLNRGELDGLGRVQLSLQEINKAVFTLKLNTMLFPEESYVLRSFSKALLRQGDTLQARLYLEKAAQYPGQ